MILDCVVFIVFSLNYGQWLNGISFKEKLRWKIEIFRFDRIRIQFIWIHIAGFNISAYMLWSCERETREKVKADLGNISMPMMAKGRRQKYRF